MAEVRNIDVLKAYLKLWDSWPSGGTFPGLRDGDQKAAEYLACVREIVAEAEAEAASRH